VGVGVGVGVFRTAGTADFGTAVFGRTAVLLQNCGSEPKRSEAPLSNFKTSNCKRRDGETANCELRNFKPQTAELQTARLRTADCKRRNLKTFASSNQTSNGETAGLVNYYS